MFKWIFTTIIGGLIGLFIAGNIYFTNESFASFLYYLIFIGTILLVLLLFIVICYILFRIFGNDFFGGVNKFGFTIIIIGIIGIGIILKYLNNNDGIKLYQKNLANNISNHFVFEKGKMPIFSVDVDK